MKRLILFTVVLFALIAGPVEADPVVTGWLYVPSLGMVEPLFESAIGTDGLHQIPDRDAVHLSGTAWLDTTLADLHNSGGRPDLAVSNDYTGRIVLAGHNPGVFAAIQNLRGGEVVYLASWPEGAFFRVTGAYMVSADDWRWLTPTIEQTLTFVLCMGDQRLIVEAVRV